MKKETLKTLILTLLIFSSVILSVQVLLQNASWTTDISLLSLLAGTESEKEEAININDTGALSSVFSPSSFLLTYADGRLFYSSTQQEGKDIRTPFNRILKSALQSENAVTVTEEDWQSALQQQSVYADYFVPVSVDAMSAFLGNTKTARFDTEAFDRIVVCFNPVTSGAEVFLRDSASDKQVSIPVGDATALQTMFDSFANAPKQSYSYAFELNLDKKMDGADVQQNVLLDSYVLLPLEPHAMNIIRAQNVAFNEKNTDRILTLFGYNPKIVRKFTENNGNLLFVDQYSTLSVNPASGQLIYTAESGRGIPLQGDGSLSSNATACGKLLDDLFNLFEMDPNVTLFINTPLTGTAKDKYTVSFEYLFDGNRILSKKNSCEITVDDGKIINFRATIRNYTLVSDAGERHAIEVLDYLYSSMEQDMLVVNELYTGYTQSNGDMPMTWKAGIEGSREIITVE